MRGANDQAQEESPAIPKDIALLLELERNLANSDRPDNIRMGDGIQEKGGRAASVKRWLANSENWLLLLFDPPFCSARHSVSSRLCSPVQV